MTACRSLSSAEMPKLHRTLLTGVIALLSVLAAALAGAGCGDDEGEGATKIGGSMILATTTSTQDSGLLDVLVPLFQKQTGIEVKVIAVGTGAALAMSEKGDADAVLTHAPTSEKKYVDQGDLVEGALVMHNDFVLVGPPSDPAGAKQAKDLNEALRAIAATGPFISRGDNSGTHTAELVLWKAAGVDLRAVKNREETGQGMGATLNVADQKQGYTLTDRATYLSLKKGATGSGLKLDVTFQKAAPLLNIYHVYVVNPAKHTSVKAAQARAFAAFMVSPETQRIIGDFKKAEYGEPLFVADAGKKEADLAVN